MANSQIIKRNMLCNNIVEYRLSKTHAMKDIFKKDDLINDLATAS